MSKTKLKNIESVAASLKNKFNCTSDEQLKIGVIVCADNFDENSHAITLGNMIKNQVLKNNADAEIICIPSLNERFRIFNAQNYVLSAYKNQIADMLELVNAYEAIKGATGPDRNDVIAANVQKIFKLHEENIWIIGFLQAQPSRWVVNKSVKNFPATAMYVDEFRFASMMRPEQLYISK